MVICGSISTKFSPTVPELVLSLLSPNPYISLYSVSHPLLTNFFYSSGRFRGGGKNGGSKSPGPGNGAQPASPTGTSQSGSSSTSLAPRMPPLPSSPSLSQTLSMDDSTGSLPGGDPLAFYNLPRPKPLWLNDAYSKHIVKGNFMTLSARPKTVEQGEWIAHQGWSCRSLTTSVLLTRYPVTEHYRNLWNFVRVVHDKDEDGTSICNSQTCPRMSAGA